MCIGGHPRAIDLSNVNTQLTQKGDEMTIASTSLCSAQCSVDFWYRNTVVVMYLLIVRGVTSIYDPYSIRHATALGPSAKQAGNGLYVTEPWTVDKNAQCKLDDPYLDRKVSAYYDVTSKIIHSKDRLCILFNLCMTKNGTARIEKIYTSRYKDQWSGVTKDSYG